MAADTPPVMHIDALFDLFETRCADNHTLYSMGAYTAPESAQKHIVDASRSYGEPITVFHSASLPPVPLRRFSRGLRRAHASFEHHIAVLALVIVQRYEERTGLLITSLMAHRLFATAMLVAAKAHQDRFPSIRNLATTIGVPVHELVAMEWALCESIEWHLIVVKEDVRLFVSSIANKTSDAVDIGEFQLCCRSSFGSKSSSVSALSNERSAASSVFSDADRSNSRGWNRQSGKNSAAIDEDDSPVIPSIAATVRA